MITTAQVKKEILVNHLNLCRNNLYIRSPSNLLQGPTAACQQMDDLFDVLIESGGKRGFNCILEQLS